MTHLTYTSGTLDPSTDTEFEESLARARSTDVTPLPHVIAGESVFEGAAFERRDPSHTDTPASSAHAAERSTVEKAVEAARGARAAWRQTPYQQRCAQLRTVADKIAQRQIELAAVVSLETGKTRTESILEVAEAVDIIRGYTDYMEENAGYTQPLESYLENERNTDTLRPYGTFGVVAPFNFPAALSIGMIGAALTAGNTVVFKPSAETPWTGALLAEMFAAADLPKGTFNLVHGGAASGEALVNSAVDGMAFTGSAAVGRQIAATMNSGDYPRPALLELGGKNPAIVTDKADVAKAAEGVARAAFGLSGQKCSACSRAIVTEGVYRDFLEALVAFTCDLVVGDPAEASTFVGPVVNEAAVRRFEKASGAAARDGVLAIGGDRPDLPGHYVNPTVVADLPTSHWLTREELFLPFVTVTRVASLEEAIHEANAVRYGLTAGIFSEDAAEVDRFLDEIESGILYVNRRAGATTGAWPRTQSFCGWKASGATGKGGLGPHYVPQFMREQSRTVAV